MEFNDAASVCQIIIHLDQCLWKAKSSENWLSYVNYFTIAQQISIGNVQSCKCCLYFFWNIILVSGWLHLDGRIHLHAKCWVSSFSDLYPIQSSAHKETSTEFDYPVFLSIFFGSTRSIYNFSPCSSINF